MSESQLVLTLPKTKKPKGKKNEFQNMKFIHLLC